MAPTPRPLLDRFTEKYVITADGCWRWTGALAQGYGRIYIREGEIGQAHRVAHELFLGPVPDELYVCHRCDNHWCVNPEHLFLGTQKDNIADMHAKGRENRDVRCRGSRHGGSKLTEDQVREIRRLCREGHSNRALANTYGVSFGLIGHIRNRRSWAHLED